MKKKYIISLLTANKPGVLSKISGLLRRKLFNIDSLTVGPTVDIARSRFTIVIIGQASEAQKASLMLGQLVEVYESVVLENNPLVREIVLARFQVDTDADEAFLHKAERGILKKEIWRKGAEICMELVDTSQRLDLFIEKVENSNVKVLEWVRSGMIAIGDLTGDRT